MDGRPTILAGIKSTVKVTPRPSHQRPRYLICTPGHFSAYQQRAQRSISTPKMVSATSHSDAASRDRLATGSRLIVVSNRLPVTIKVDSSQPGGYSFALSSGGLVSALSGAKKRMSFTWIGWPGLSVPTREDELFIESKLEKEYSCRPVWLDPDVADAHYNGFSNSILWPLFHYHPGEMNFDEGNWLAYREANLRFAESVREIVRKGDMVWVQVSF